MKLPMLILIAAVAVLLASCAGMPAGGTVTYNPDGSFSVIAAAVTPEK